jgi:hypothetical protein
MKGLIAIIVIGIIVIYFNREQPYHPKKIWTYWDNPDSIPKTVTKCMSSWAKWNPRDEIVLLTKKNYKGYVTIPQEIATHPNFNDNPTRFADLVRIWTLAEHGGIWIDSSTIVNTSLSWVYPWYINGDKEFSGFYLDGFTEEGKTPVIENWFFACTKGSPFVRAWRDEFSQMARYQSVEIYVTSRIRMGVDPQKISNTTYLAMHIAVQKVLQIDRYPMDTLLLRKAEDGSLYTNDKKIVSYFPHMTGPYEYLVKAKWNSEKAIEGLCGSSYDMVKLRGAERKVLETRDDIQECLF